MSQCGNVLHIGKLVGLCVTNGEVFGNLNSNIGMKQKELDELMFSPNLDAHAIKICRKEFTQLMHREEIMWKQRAKDYYIKEGDRNIRYFHMTISRRKHNNFIFGIKDELGSWQQDPKRIEEVVLRYFKDTFTSSKPTNVDAIYERIEQRISQENRNQLDQEFNEIEIKEALNQRC